MGYLDDRFGKICIVSYNRTFQMKKLDYQDKNGIKVFFQSGQYKTQSLYHTIKSKAYHWPFFWLYKRLHNPYEEYIVLDIKYKRCLHYQELGNN